MVITFRIDLEGMAARLLLLIYLILHSTSATCSHALLVLITTLSSSGINLLNSMSIRFVCTIKPALAYRVIICFRFHADWVSVQVGMNSAIISLIPCPHVTTNGKLLTNIISAESITYLVFVLYLVGFRNSLPPLAPALDKQSCLSGLWHLH